MPAGKVNGSGVLAGDVDSGADCELADLTRGPDLKSLASIRADYGRL